LTTGADGFASAAEVPSHLRITKTSGRTQAEAGTDSHSDSVS